MAGKNTNITILGLGPGDPGLLTRAAWEHINSLQTIMLRTTQHPTVAGFPAGLHVESFDSLYDAGESFEGVYAQIVERVLELGRREGERYEVLSGLKPGEAIVAGGASFLTDGDTVRVSNAVPAAPAAR